MQNTPLRSVRIALCIHHTGKCGSKLTPNIPTIYFPTVLHHLVAYISTLTAILCCLYAVLRHTPKALGQELKHKRDLWEFTSIMKRQSHAYCNVKLNSWNLPKSDELICTRSSSLSICCLIKGIQRLMVFI